MQFYVISKDGGNVVQNKIFDMRVVNKNPCILKEI